jgi:hypothetical protein
MDFLVRYFEEAMAGRDPVASLLEERKNLDNHLCIIGKNHSSPGLDALPLHPPKA